MDLEDQLDVYVGSHRQSRVADVLDGDLSVSGSVGQRAGGRGRMGLTIAAGAWEWVAVIAVIGVVLQVPEPVGLLDHHLWMPVIGLGGVLVDMIEQQAVAIERGVEADGLAVLQQEVLGADQPLCPELVGERIVLCIWDRCGDVVGGGRQRRYPPELDLAPRIGVGR